MMKQDIKGSNSYVRNEREAEACIKVVVNFLRMFIPETTAKKLVSVILIAAGMSVAQITALTGLCRKNIQSTGCAVRDGRISEMLAHKKNSGRKRKTAAVEEQIIAELETGSYHSRQQIADMIKEKFQITISLPAVGRLLKKRF